MFGHGTSDWVTYYDEYQRPYYHNSRTGETSWVMPGGSQPPPPPPPAPAYPSEKPSHHTSPHNQEYAAHLGDDRKHRPRPVDSIHIAQHAEQFQLKEKVMSITGDSFSIWDASGRQRYKISGQTVSLHERKKLRDMNGNPLYELSENMISLRVRQKVVDSRTGQTVLTMRKKSFIPNPFSSTFLVWKGASDDGTPWIECKGNILKKNFQLTEVGSGRPVGRVSRKMLRLKNIMFGQDAYTVEVMPGYDIPLVLLIVVGIDEAYHDEE